jgi:hypothetical protein
MKRTIIMLSAVCFATGIVSAQNLLLNGDFNSPDSIAAPDSWNVWSYGGANGWANHQLDSSSFDGSWYMACGGNDSGGGGVNQTVADITPGATYTLSVESGAQAWWKPLHHDRDRSRQCRLRGGRIRQLRLRLRLV